MTDNTALAQELEGYIKAYDDANYPAINESYDVVYCVSENAKAILAALRTPAPAPVGGGVVEALRQARDDLLAVGNDYPGSSCQKWCTERAKAAWDTLRPWEHCPSTHCERTQECRSVNECSANKSTVAALQAQPAQAQGDVLERACDAFMSKITVGGNGGIEFLEEGIIAAIAAMPPKVEAPAADEVRELAHKLRGVAAPVAAADITSSSWVYEIQYGPEGESNYAHVFASDGRLIAVMKVSDAAKIAAIRAGGQA